MSVCSSSLDLHCRNSTSVRSQGGSWWFVMDICGNFFNIHSSLLFFMGPHRETHVVTRKLPLLSGSGGQSTWLSQSKSSHPTHLAIVIHYQVSAMTSGSPVEINLRTFVRIPESRVFSPPLEIGSLKLLQPFCYHKGNQLENEAKIQRMAKKWSQGRDDIMKS